MIHTSSDERAEPAEMMEVLSPGSTGVVLEIAAPAPVRGAAATFTRNSALSVGRLLVSTLVALILPAYLTHKLPVKTYSAWVLILQMSAYVGYLDFGVQTGISKYVAEYEARGDSAGANMRASAGLAIISVMSVLGVLLTLVLAWRVPHLFREMPGSLYHDVRLSLLLVGVSLSFGLLCSIFSAVFLGLQSYAVPMILSLFNRFAFTAAVAVAVLLHSSLAVMGGMVAIVHIVTGLLQIAAWRKYARKVRLSLYGLDFGVVKKMLGYCSALAVWTVAMLCISGLDVTIVGRYDFGQTAFYSIGTLPTNFMISILGAALAPFLPTASAMNVHLGPRAMGEMLSRVTRYSSTLLILCGLPLMVGGYWILRLWLGPAYAAHSVGYLRILVLANVVRCLCLPYSSMLVATESQKVAIAGATAEAMVNVGASVYLASRIGAVGVAYGTLLGAFVGVAMHFGLSMRYTYIKFSVSRARLFFTGIARPLLIAVPSLLLAPFWWRSAAPSFHAAAWPALILVTVLLAWFGALNPMERTGLKSVFESRLKSLTAYNKLSPER